MRALAIVLLAGCGRLGFDESDPTLAPDDAPVQPKLCGARLIGQLPLGTEIPVKLRATALSTGHALAIQTDLDNTYMVRLDPAGDIVSTHLPFGGGYRLHGISQIADRPFVYVFTAGAGYIKLLMPDWDSYEIGPSGEARSMDPQQALLPSGAAAIYGVVMSGGTLDIHTIDSANTILGDADYAPPASFASFASSPNGVRVVVENAGACETFAIAGNGTTGARHVFSPCFEPRLAAIGTSGFVLYRTVTGGALTLHRIPQDAAQAGETIPLEIGTNPRIATIDGAIWVAYLGSNGQARLVRVDGETLTMRDDPSIVSSFDLLPSGVFWVTPTGAIHTGTPCL